MNLFESLHDIEDTNYIDFKIKELRKDHKKVLFKNITKYSMIAVEKRIRFNEKEKQKLDIECDKKFDIEKTKPKEQDYTFLKDYVAKKKKLKTNWSALENVLKTKVALDIYDDVNKAYIKDLKKLLNELKIDFKKDYTYLIDGIELDDMITDIIKWLKRHYNSIRMIRANKRRTSNKYYHEVLKSKNKYTSVIEANKQIAIEKTEKSKELVLDTITKLQVLNIKITIANITKEIAKNSSKKLGKTQIAKYLKELRIEGKV